jgi:hypothetical protein
VLPGGLGSARNERVGAILYQVRWAGWQQSIGSWTSYSRSGWSVTHGILTLDSAAGGVRECDSGIGVPYCDTVATLFAPYRVPVRKYEITTKLRIINGNWNEFKLGLVFRFRPVQTPPAHKDWGISGHWALASPTGFAVDLRSSLSLLSPGFRLGMSAETLRSTKPPAPRLIGWRPGNTWHTYQVQVRGSLYRLLIDGQYAVEARDARPDSVWGRQFGFFANTAHIQVGMVRISVLP